MGTYYEKQQERSKKPMIAGVLMIIAFILAVVAAGQMFFLEMGGIYLEGGENVELEFIERLRTICGGVYLLLGIFLLIGGVLAIKRIYWGVALVASIVGLFHPAPFFSGSILSLVSLILIGMSKDEFNGKDTKEWEYQNYLPPPPQNHYENNYCSDCGTHMRPDEQGQLFCPHCKNNSGDYIPPPKDTESQSSDSPPKSIGERISIIETEMNSLKDEERMIDTRAIEKALEKEKVDRAEEHLDDLKSNYEEYKETLEELKSLDNSKYSLAEKLADGEIDKDVFNDAKRSIESRKAKLEEELDNLRREVIHEDYEKPF